MINALQRALETPRQRNIILYQAAETILFIFGIMLLKFHKYRMNIKLKLRSPDYKAPTLDPITLSYAIIILNMFRSITTIILRISHSIYPWLNLYGCYAWLLICVSFLLISKFCIHLFVVARTRLALHNSEQYSKTYKIGLALISTDILALIFGWIQILFRWEIEYKQNNCIAIKKGYAYIWLVISDNMISVYCLLAFVLPLRKHMKFEKYVNKGEPRNNQNGAKVRNLVIRVVVFSTVMLVTDIMYYAIVLPFRFSAQWIGIIDATINAYCVVMQFSPVDSSKIENKCWRKFVKLFQCDACLGSYLSTHKDGTIQGQNQQEFKEVRIDSTGTTQSSEVVTATKSVEKEMKSACDK